MKKILIFLSLLYLTSCKGCTALSRIESSEECNKREASYGYECCQIKYQGLYFGQGLNGNNCIEIEKTMDLKTFVRQYEELFKRDELRFDVIDCSKRSYFVGEIDLEY